MAALPSRFISPPTQVIRSSFHAIHCQRSVVSSSSSPIFTLHTTFFLTHLLTLTSHAAYSFSFFFFFLLLLLKAYSLSIFRSLFFSHSLCTQPPFPSLQYRVSSSHHCISPLQYLLPLGHCAPSASRQNRGSAKLTRFKVISAAPIPFNPRFSSLESYARDTEVGFTSIF